MEQGQPHRWIPTEYLRSFVTGKPELGKVDTAAILCDGLHSTGKPDLGKVDTAAILCDGLHSTGPRQHDFTEPSQPTQNKLRPAPPAKRISVAAWEEIVKLQGLTGSEVTENDCCYSCAQDFVSQRVRELTRIEQDFRGLELLDRMGRATEDRENVYMSSQWIKRWKARSKTKAFVSLKKDPWELLVTQRKKPQDKAALDAADLDHIEEMWNLNVDLQCPHGNLVPDSSLWQEVTPDVWAFFVEQREHSTRQSVWAVGQPRHPPKFLATASGCPECHAGHQEKVRSAEHTKAQADEERKDEHLALLFGIHACDPGTMYRHCIGQKENPLYVVATSWLNNWRQYIAPGKGKSNVARRPPGAIDNHSLLCPHQKLKCAPFPFSSLSFETWPSQQIV